MGSIATSPEADFAIDKSLYLRACPEGTNDGNVNLPVTIDITDTINY
jgi:hypothetical protein